MDQNVWPTRNTKELNKRRDTMLKIILKTPVTNPQKALYLETGLIDMEMLATMIKINMLHVLLRHQMERDMQQIQLAEQELEGNSTEYKEK